MFHKFIHLNRISKLPEILKLSKLIVIAALLCNAGISAAENSQKDMWALLQPFFDSTHLLEIKQGSELSSKASDLLAGGFETSQGDRVSFKNWYQTKWTDTRAIWLTQINPNFGLIWGFSTGENAEKYQISRSMTIGFAFNKPLDKTSFISIKGTTIVGGNLKEKSCTADYGEIGGVQNVNCRLAASTLAPSDTLPFLFNDKPVNKNIFFITYTKLF